MAVQRSRSDASLFGDVIQACLRAELSEGRFGNLQNAAAIPFRIGAEFSLGSWGMFGGHRIKFATGDDLR